VAFPWDLISGVLDRPELWITVVREQKHRCGAVSERVQDAVAVFEGDGQRCQRMRVGCQNHCTLSWC